MNDPVQVWNDGRVTVFAGDSREVLQHLSDSSIDSVVCDPPYELTNRADGATTGFMDQAWDGSGIAFDSELWRECLRVLKPGGFLLAFGAPRTVHRMTVAIEDAGGIIQDQIVWIRSGSMPKSVDVSKAIDKTLHRQGVAVEILKVRLAELFAESGKTRKAIDSECGFRASNYLTVDGDGKRPDPWVNVLPPAGKWQRMKEVLGCADDPIVDAEMDRYFADAQREVIGWKAVRPGVAFGTTGPSRVPVTAPATDAARQWTGWGTALRPAYEPIVVARKVREGTVARNVLTHNAGALNVDGCRVPYETNGTVASNPSLRTHVNGGNGGHVIATETERRVSVPHDAGRWPPNIVLTHDPECSLGLPCELGCPLPPFDAGTERDGAELSRMFPVFRYEPKADNTERPEVAGVRHPTVKPLNLIRWLVRLVTPPGGLVLDPFAGSGTTAEASVLEGMRCVTVEITPEYLPLIVARLSRPVQEGMFPV